MNRAYIAFGANLSNPRAMFLSAVTELGEAGIVIRAASSLWRSPAWPPGTDAPDYINAVLKIETVRRPTALLDLLLGIEAKLGRVRSVRNAPRTIDLDLIDYAGERVETDRLNLPHPRMKDRAFVLLPLQQVTPDWIHPDGETIAQLIAATDCSETIRL